MRLGGAAHQGGDRGGRQARRRYRRGRVGRRGGRGGGRGGRSPAQVRRRLLGRPRQRIRETGRPAV